MVAAPGVVHEGHADRKAAVGAAPQVGVAHLATVMVDAQGNRLELVRDRPRNLREIVASRGGWITLSLDDQARIVRAENHEGHWREYRYDAAGMLAEATSVDGRARRYSYVDELLTQVHDEQGRLLVRNWYDGKWLVRQDYANGESLRFRYQIGSSRYYADETTVVRSDRSSRMFRTAESVSQHLKDFKPPR